ncbi:M20/M25/M40 family metallo-hydrolase [Ktedonospora formicarum]|uniref:Glutamate carboxypeptidase n=1 Tax=Ktedonospora formicarum TaxID=2778364 RepID=A0A8J3IA79_9CHLR|nr:M20/M25/M40 family metallo-hydrolase [Ktedonospora formicarum]GHO48558.1 glutamate carboxypeptidase [Ktedonospora formicarum]
MTSLPLVVEARRWFDEVRLADFVETLMRLAAIASGTQYVPGINTKISYYKEWLEELGFEVMLYDVPEYGNNLAATLKGSGDEDDVSLALIGHVDTVYSREQLTQNPPHIEEERLYGLGTSDMHGGNLLMLEALRFLHAQNFTGFRKILVILNNDEEQTSPHSRPWYRQLLREHSIDVGFEFESQDKRLGDGIHVTVARRGVQVYKFEVRGKAGHSGIGGGISAIDALASKYMRLLELVAQHSGMSCNATSLSGGVGIQITTIPEKAEVTMAFRAMTPKEFILISRFMETIRTNRGGLEEGVEATYKLIAFTPPPYTPTEGINRLARMAQEVAERLDLPFGTEWKGGTSDANAFAEFEVPVLASMGPLGDGDHNGAEEHMLLGKPLVDKFVFVASFIGYVCSMWKMGD